MNRRLLAGLAAAVAAVVGLVLVISYANGADARAQSALEPVTVLVVKEAIPAGTPVENLSDALDARPLPASAVAPSALGSLEGKAGLVTSTGLAPGEPLLAERLVDPDTLSAPGSVPVPKGLQEVTFSVDAARIVGGKIAAGDTVGIFASFEEGAVEDEAATTQRVFHKVLVTTVQRDGTAAAAQENPEALPTGGFLVTVAVNDADAHKIVFASEFGRLWLTKEPKEATESDPKPMTIKEVYP